MKIKGNSGISLKLTGIIAAVIFGLLFIVRLYQTFALTDGTTGFFTEDNFSVSIMYILFGAGILLSCILCYLCSGLPLGDMKKKPSMLYFVSAILFAITLFYDAFKNIQVILGTQGDFAIKKEAVGGNIGIFSTVFGVLGALCLILSAVIYLKSGSLSGKLSIPMLFPVLWAFLETLGFFSITVSYVKVSQLLLTIFSAAFLMVFLFENARVTTGIGRKDSIWFFYASGIITVGLALSAGVPAFISSIVSPEKVVSYCPFEFYTLGGGLYALAAMLVRNRVEDEKSDSVTETE